MKTTQQITEQNVRDALMEVMDPEIPHLSIVDLGVLHKISLTDNTLALDSAFAAAHPGSFIDAGTPNQVDLIVVPEPGAELTAEDLWRWCGPRLPDFAVPRYVRFTDALPMTPSGKVRKAPLREAGVDAGTADRERVPHPS